MYFQNWTYIYYIFVKYLLHVYYMFIIINYMFISAQGMVSDFVSQVYGIQYEFLGIIFMFLY